MATKQKSIDRDTVRPGYLRRSGAARYLGISVRTLANLQARRILPFSKLGSRTVLFKVSDLDSAVCRYRQDAIVEG